MPQIKYHIRLLSKLFSSIIFCNWTTPSTKKNVHIKNKKKKENKKTLLEKQYILRYAQNLKYSFK